MIDITVVGEQLHGLGSVFRRKVSADMVTAYHNVLDRRIGEDEFVESVMGIMEHETSFPAPSLILQYARSWSRNRWELGEPYVYETRLGEFLDQLEGKGPLPATESQFANMVERLEYEDAVVTAGEPPIGQGEDDLLHWIQGIAEKAEGNLAKIAEMDAAKAPP